MSRATVWATLALLSSLVSTLALPASASGCGPAPAYEATLDSQVLLSVKAVQWPGHAAPAGSLDVFVEGPDGVIHALGRIRVGERSAEVATGPGRVVILLTADRAEAWDLLLENAPTAENDEGSGGSLRASQHFRHQGAAAACPLAASSAPRARHVPGLDALVTGAGVVIAALAFSWRGRGPFGAGAPARPS